MNTNPQLRVIALLAIAVSLLGPNRLCAEEPSNNNPKPLVTTDNQATEKEEAAHPDKMPAVAITQEEINPEGPGKALGVNLSTILEGSSDPETGRLILNRQTALMIQAGKFPFFREEGVWAMETAKNKSRQGVSVAQLCDFVYNGGQGPIPGKAVVPRRPGKQGLEDARNEASINAAIAGWKKAHGITQ